MTSRSHIVPAVLAALIVGLMVTGVWAAADLRRGTVGGLDEPMATAVAELEAFVASARGLPFLEPVDVAVLDDAAFRRALSGGEPLEELDVEVETGVLRALGLVDEGDDLGSAGELDAATVAGFYDTETRELVVRGARLTPFVRQVLVHELVHALDDQHFDLEPDVVDDEAALAFEALVEGNAVRIEARYLDSLPPEERRQAAAEEEAAFVGWAGDRYVAWQAGRRTCVRTTVVLDSAAEAGELVAALRQWGVDHPGTTVEPGPSAVTFTRCA